MMRRTMNRSAKPLPYRNPKFSAAQHVKDLLARMKLEGKVAQMMSVGLENFERTYS